MVDFLVRAASEFRRGGWVFTGFHWPVLAGQLAARLDGSAFVQCFEAGAATWGAARQVPTSTTDYPSYANGLHYTAATGDVLLALARRFDRAVLDAGNVDVLGRVNSSYLGARNRPRVRMPGGGGSADVAARARELVWLHGGADMRRIQAQVEHVTAAPAAGAEVRLHCRWGVVRLGARPRLEQLAEPGAAAFSAHLDALGVDVGDPSPCAPPSRSERAAAIQLLTEAAERGYDVAGRALMEEQ